MPLCFRVREYDDIWTDLPTFTQSWNTVLVPTSCSSSLGASHAITLLVSPEKRMLAASPIIYLKAVKNVVEREGMKKAHIKDAVAMCKFFGYFESRVSETFIYSSFLDHS